MELNAQALSLTEKIVFMEDTLYHYQRDIPTSIMARFYPHLPSINVTIHNLFAWRAQRNIISADYDTYLLRLVHGYLVRDETDAQKIRHMLRKFFYPIMFKCRASLKLKISIYLDSIIHLNLLH